ncbi:MAG: hypothetical protein PUE58_06345 [Lachnospiraceae bacterium]|nr:hypothetical protein [Lachnospiraceae bacterium]
MPTFLIVLLIITAVLVAFTIFLYFFGKRAEKKRDEQEAQIQAAAQTVSMLIIDKKMVRLKDSGLPENVIESTPWYGKRAKVPVVKVKVGPKVMTMIAANEIYDDIPVKKEVKASVSGLYINSVRGLHGKIEHTPKKKKGFRAKLMNRYKSLKEETKSESGKGKKK